MAADSSIKGLMKDKRMQLAAAGVGGVGLLVLLMRRGGGAPSSGGGGGGGQSMQPANPAGLDSSGADLYNALQDLGQGWQRDLNGFTKELSNVNDKLAKFPSGGTGAAPKPVPQPAGRKYLAPSVDGGRYALVTVGGGGESWTSNLNDIAHAYGWSDAKTMWNDSGNTALRGQRGVFGNAVLKQGDQVRVWWNPNKSEMNSVLSKYKLTPVNGFS